jgi:predicted nucleic acid-binding protein
MSDAVPRPLIYLDTNIFIFFYEGAPLVSERVKTLFEGLRSHPGRGITSELTLAEVLAESEQPRPPGLKRSYLELIVWSGFLELVPVSRGVLYESAELRTVHRTTHGRKLDLPDAIHLTTAIQARCSFFISADEGIRPPSEMTRLSPIAAGLDQALAALS